MSDKDIPKGKPVYMLCVNDLSVFGEPFKKYAILDMTGMVKYEDGAYTGSYNHKGVNITVRGWGVELFYSKEGAIAFAAAHRLSGNQEEYMRDYTKPPKP